MQKTAFYAISCTIVARYWQKKAKNTEDSAEIGFVRDILHYLSPDMRGIDGKTMKTAVSLTWPVSDNWVSAGNQNPSGMTPPAMRVLPIAGVGTSTGRIWFPGLIPPVQNTTRDLCLRTDKIILTILFGELLEGEAGITVEKVDNAAVAEAGFFDAMAHDDVVFVGVDAEVMDLRPAPVEAGGSYTVGIHGAREPVDGGIWKLVINPGPAVDYGIGRIHTGDERKSAHNGSAASIRTFANDTSIHGSIFVHDSIALPCLNVIADNLLGRVTGFPLIHITARKHDLPPLTINLHETRQIFNPASAYRKHIQFI